MGWWVGRWMDGTIHNLEIFRRMCFLDVLMDILIT